MKELKKHNFIKVFDLQNSSRTNFYKNILSAKATNETWSSSITTLPNDKNKAEFDKISVLDKFNHQLKTSNLTTQNTLKKILIGLPQTLMKLIKKNDLQKYIQFYFHFALLT